jgi:hypothetical protein
LALFTLAFQYIRHPYPNLSVGSFKGTVDIFGGIFFLNSTSSKKATGEVVL